MIYVYLPQSSTKARHFLVQRIIMNRGYEYYMIKRRKIFHLNPSDKFLMVDYLVRVIYAYKYVSL